MNYYKDYRANKGKTSTVKKKKRKLKPGVKKVIVTSAMIFAILVAGKGLGSMADNNYPTNLDMDNTVIQQVIENDNFDYGDSVSIEETEDNYTSKGNVVEEEDNTVYFELGYNDAKPYYAVGKASLPVSADFVYEDASDLDADAAYYRAEDFFNDAAGIDYHFYPSNTKIRIEKGLVAEMTRVYIP